MKKIIIGSDHAGYHVKELIKKYLEKKKIPYEDVGGKSPYCADDYPDIAKKAAKKVLKSKGLGILVCGTGTGMAIAANKVKGIRAAFCFDSYSSKMARQDNNANILALRERKFPKKKIIPIVAEFLKNDFSGIARHKRRIKKLE